MHVNLPYTPVIVFVSVYHGHSSQIVIKIIQVASQYDVKNESADNECVVAMMYISERK